MADLLKEGRKTYATSSAQGLHATDVLNPWLLWVNIQLVGYPYRERGAR